MAATDLTPGAWPITIVQGDDLPEHTFTVRADGVAVSLSRSLAQVRKDKLATSTVLMTITTSEAGGDVTLGGDTVDLPPGVYWWDLETESTELGVRTVLGDTFRVIAGVSVDA